MAKTFLILRKKVEEIKEVLHFKNSIEHKILVTYVIAKVSVYENDQLVYGYCLKDSNPILGDIDIFKNSIEDLKAIDSEFIEGKKYILFKNLGICIGGMTGKKIPEGKLLIAFDKNHFDFFECFIEV